MGQSANKRDVNQRDGYDWNLDRSCCVVECHFSLNVAWLYRYISTLHSLETSK